MKEKTITFGLNFFYHTQIKFICIPFFFDRYKNKYIWEYLYLANVNIYMIIQTDIQK